MIRRNQAKTISKWAFGAAMSDDVRVAVSSTQAGNTRFANNGITTTGDVSRVSVTVTASVQGRTASVTGNRADKASVEALVREAEELAAVSPVDPEHMPGLGKQTYPKVKGRDTATAGMTAEARADAVAKIIRRGRESGMAASGFMEHEDRTRALATSNGLFAYHESTALSLSTTFRTSDGTGSGRAAFESHRLADLDAEALAQTALEKADMSRSPEELAPGKATVVLEPQAVADLMSFFMRSMNARSADEGRSFFSATGGGTRVGEKLFSDRITLKSAPADPAYPADPIGDDGLPQADISWVEAGVLKQLSRSRYWAQKTGKSPVPVPSSMHLQGSSSPLLDLIKGVERGVLVTRFWYNRMVEPRTILATGLTRDGTFLIEQGKLVGAVKNFRYNDSPVTLLTKVRALGTPERVPTGGMVAVVPPMVDDFNLASISDAV